MSMISDICDREAKRVVREHEADVWARIHRDARRIASEVCDDRLKHDRDCRCATEDWDGPSNINEMRERRNEIMEARIKVAEWNSEHQKTMREKFEKEADNWESRAHQNAKGERAADLEVERLRASHDHWVRVAEEKSQLADHLQGECDRHGKVVGKLRTEVAELQAGWAFTRNWKEAHDKVDSRRRHCLRLMKEAEAEAVKTAGRVVMAKAAVEAKNLEIASLHRKIEKMTSDLTGTGIEIMNKEKYVNELLGKNDSLVRENHALRGETYRDKWEHCEEELEKADLTISNLQGENATLKNENAQVMDELETAGYSDVQLREQNTDLANQIKRQQERWEQESDIIREAAGNILTELQPF